MSPSRIPDDEVPLGIADEEILLNGDESHLPEEKSERTSAFDDPIARRRADIDAKQEKVARILDEMRCEGVILLMPAHVGWFTCGMNVRGMIAENERPGIYTNGRQRWLLCSNTDTQRLFDEELDGLGFQLKEWAWNVGRAALLGELVAGKPCAADRPFPNMPMIIDRLRTELRPLSAYEMEQYAELGRKIGYALESTARKILPGDSEQEIAGQIAHRMLRYGVEAHAISVSADGRAASFRRSGFTSAPFEKHCLMQATGHCNGLYATASRTVHFGPPSPEFRTMFDTAIKISAVDRSFSVPGESIGNAAEAGRSLLHNGPFEFEWRHCSPGYGAGRFAAEELRKAGHDEKFAAGWALTWQARLGSAAILDTVVVAEGFPIAITPPDGWPYKRVRIREIAHDIPDMLIRQA